MTYYQGYGTTYQNQAWPHGCQCQHERCRVPGCQYQVRASQPTACAPLLARQQPHLVVLRPHDDWPEESDCCGDAFCRCVDWLLTGVCYVILTLLLFASLFGVVVFFLQHYGN